MRNSKIIFKQIEARYGDEQPKGGVVYKTPVDLKNRTIDSYGRGNVHNSIHQYKPKSSQWWNRPMPFPSDLRPIVKALKAGGEWTLGAKSDGFMWMDRRYRHTYKVLQLAKHYKVKLTIHTMSDLVAHDDYIHLLKGHTIVMNMGSGESEAQELLDSPGAPSLKRRIEAVQTLLHSGIEVLLIDKNKNLSRPEMNLKFKLELKPRATKVYETFDPSEALPNNVINMAAFRTRKVA